ncbi:helix-turn-helix domain-containing protein [soil metagenome]
MEPITFDQLPKAVSGIYQKLESIERLLQLQNDPQQLADRWFDLSELCSYLPDKPAKATVYAYVSANTIPVHKSGKKLRFLKSEIDSWLLEGRKKTLAEIANDADAFLSNIKKRRI